MKLSQKLRRSIIDEDEKTDPYWNNVISLLNFENSINANSTDDYKGHSFTANNANAYITDEDSRFGTKCLYLNGSNSYMSSQLSGFGPGPTNDFTIEFSFKSLKESRGMPFYLGNCFNTSSCRRIALFTDNGRRMRFYAATAPDLQVYVSDVYYELNKWHAVAGVRHGNNWHLFLDGKLIATTYLEKTTGLETNKQIFLGVGYYGGINYYHGYIDEIRYTLGVARYTSDYKVRKSPFPTQ